MPFRKTLSILSTSRKPPSSAAFSWAVTYESFPDGLKKTVTNPNGTVSTYLYDAGPTGAAPSNQILR